MNPSVMIAKLQKQENPTCHLIILQHFDAKTYKHLDEFTINVKSGTIENPSKLPNSTWWNLYDRKHNLSSVKEILIRYGIDANSINQFAL